ncbi:MAG: DUF3168 domain-containing protein [Neorhizobium sp.]|nr:DUF3168 domain-containing protein [Neorhizobium sp.]
MAGTQSAETSGDAMAVSAQNALLAAIWQALSDDAAIVARVGVDGIRDRLLPHPVLPAIVFADIETTDLATATEPGEAHRLTIEVWSRADGRREAEEIAALVRRRLDDRPPVLDAIALVSLLYTGGRSRRDARTGAFLSELRFRAVTE